MAAMLIRCDLRRGEVLALIMESVQQREEHWVIVDLVSRGPGMFLQRPSRLG
jgi:hypothetical protein